MRKFEPDYRHIVNAAFNVEAERLPLYEHIISYKKIEDITDTSFADLYHGDEKEVREFFRNYCKFFANYGYDCVPYEECISLAMPGSGALGDPRIDPVIKTMEDCKKYPWDEITERFFLARGKHFAALRQELPAGMRAIGGVGNGVFECVQTLVGFMNLCYIKEDDPELYQLLFAKVSEAMLLTWQRFMREYADVYGVLRFGDDLGFKSTTLLSADDVREYIIPGYRAVIEEVHSYRKPFLYHSCGQIFDVMDDIIDVGVNAKHSNEDQIGLFPEWVRRYGDRIGNFGGIDTDAVCRLNKQEMKEYIVDVLDQCKGHGGIAFGSGNSIPDYVPEEGYLNMIEIVREYRGDFRN